MALNQTNKLVWITEIIYRAHKNSFEKLNLRWMDNVDLSIGDVEVHFLNCMSARQSTSNRNCFGMLKT